MLSKVIIIDSGIDLKNDLFTGRVIGGMGIEYKNNKIDINNNCQDFNGHGSSCASIILSVCSNTYFYVIKIIEKKGNTSSELLIKALEKCKDIDIRVICISLATINPKYYEQIRNICKILNKQGKIIVSSLHNHYNKSAPAVFKSVIGIKGDNFRGQNDSFRYKKNDIIQGIYDMTPQLALKLNGKYSFFKGTSKANALAVGKILNVIQKTPDMSFEHLNQKLEEESKYFKLPREQCMIDICSDYEEEMVVKLKILLEKTIKKDVKISELKKYPLMSRVIGLNYNNFYDYLVNISKEFDISFDYKNIKADEVCTIERLISYIKLRNIRLGKVL